MVERWLDREGVAQYIKVRVDYLPRIQKAGKLPPPSLHLGPKCPRWDRHLIDVAFSGSVSNDVDLLVEGLIHDIRAKSRHKDARGR